MNRSAKCSIASSASGHSRSSRRWPSIRPIPALTITTAACTWPRCSNGAASGSPELSRMIIDDEAIRDGTPEGYSEVYRIPGPLDLTALMELMKIPNRDQLRDAPFSPQLPRGMRRRSDDLFALIAKRDILLHHPFDAFDSVVDFISRAANDPRVLAIKQTLYRT